MHYETYYVRTCQHIMYSKKIHQFEGTSLNFNLLRSIFITSIIEIVHQLILKDREKSNEIEKLKEEMQNKFDEFK